MNVFVKNWTSLIPKGESSAQRVFNVEKTCAKGNFKNTIKRSFSEIKVKVILFTNVIEKLSYNLYKCLVIEEFDKP